jgi:hypothetical protein
MAPPSQELEPPINPERFSILGMFLILLKHWRTQHSLKSNPLRRTSRVSMEREMESFLRMLRLGRRELRLVGARAKRSGRGGGRPPPPPQIRTCSFPASGSSDE